MARFTGRHPECKDCRFYRPTSSPRILSSVHCLPCGAGEFFEEKIDDHTPNDEELMDMYAKMDKIDD